MHAIFPEIVCGTVKGSEDTTMAFEYGTVSISNVHLDGLDKIGWWGYCLTLGGLGYGGKNP